MDDSVKRQPSVNFEGERERTIPGEQRIVLCIPNLDIISDVMPEPRPGPGLAPTMVTWSLWWSARCAWSSPGTCPSPAAPQVSVVTRHPMMMTMTRCRSHHLQVLQKPGAALSNLQTTTGRQYQQSGRSAHRESQTQVNSDYSRKTL